MLDDIWAGPWKYQDGKNRLKSQLYAGSANLPVGEKGQAACDAQVVFDLYIGFKGEWEALPLSRWAAVGADRDFLVSECHLKSQGIGEVSLGPQLGRRTAGRVMWEEESVRPLCVKSLSSLGTCTHSFSASQRAPSL